MFDVVGIGMNVLDILIRTVKLPTWECTIEPSAVQIDGGGLAATALTAAQKFGLRTAFIGTHGNDQNGRIKHDLLARHGVDLSHEIEIPFSENQICVVFVNENSGERHFQAKADFWDHYIDPGILDEAFICSADILHMDGYHFDAAVQAAKWMHALGKPVMFDAGRTSEKKLSGENIELVRHTDYLISGSGFLQALTGVEDVVEAGRKALTLGPRVVVQTEGEQGSFTVTQDDCFHIPAIPVPVVDTTGAGDVFHGAYLYGLCRGWNLRRITRFASAAAALECTALGGRMAIPALEAVLDLLSVQSPADFAAAGN